MALLIFTKKPVWKAVLLAVCALAVLVLPVPRLWLASYTREDTWVSVLSTCLLGFFIPQVEAVFGRALEESEAAA